MVKNLLSARWVCSGSLVVPTPKPILRHVARPKSGYLKTLLLVMTLWCSYAYDVIWYEFQPTQFNPQAVEWSAVVKALCDTQEEKENDDARRERDSQTQ